MGPRGWHYLVCSCLLCSAHGVIPGPQNVRIHSVNLNSTLLWDPPYLPEEKVMYTVEYETYPPLFNDICTKTNLTECNISDLPMYGTLILRVRTESKKGQSEWKYITFEPLRETTITSPAVRFETLNRGLYIEVSGPFGSRDGSVWPIVAFYGSLNYSMLIWKKDHEDQIRNVIINQNSKTLSDLDPGTTYCFKIQVLIDRMNKTGMFTEETCIGTEVIGENPVRLAVIIVSVLVLIPLCFIMISWVYRQVKYTYFPSYSLPEHFKEFLGKPSYSSEFVATQPHCDDRFCEKITVVSEEQKLIDSEEQPNSAKQQLQSSQGDIPGLKEIENGTDLITIQTGENNLLHLQGISRASVNTLCIADLKIVTL